MATVYNFGPGPAMLPREVMREAQAEFLDFEGSGMSIIEMSHRGERFMRVAAEAEADLRELLAIPANYKVLFMQGGATFQYAAVPINLLRGRPAADYVVTGEWGRRAIREAARYCRAHAAASTEGEGFTRAPAQAEWQLSGEAAYVHYVANETVHGVEFHWVPETGGTPLVADMSSNILSQPVDVSRYGVIYAGAQKNVGPAGVTLVIVRDDLLGDPLPGQPVLADYRTYADHESMFNTPPTFAIYLAGKTFKWLKRNGGVAAAARNSAAKSAMLYAAIDASDFYENRVAAADRSRMNVPFFLRDDTLTATFVKEAEAAGLTQLKGHKILGGMRASLYNAMPAEGVAALVDFMREFERRYG